MSKQLRSEMAEWTHAFNELREKKAHILREKQDHISHIELMVKKSHLDHTDSLNRIKRRMNRDITNVERQLTAVKEEHAKAMQCAMSQYFQEIGVYDIQDMIEQLRKLDKSLITRVRNLPDLLYRRLIDKFGYIDKMSTSASKPTKEMEMTKSKSKMVSAQPLAPPTPSYALVPSAPPAPVPEELPPPYTP